MPPRNLLPTIFSSLSRSSSSASPTRWTLLRTLKSENSNDMQGDLHGTATFTPLRSHRLDPAARKNIPESETLGDGNGYTDLLYSEEGSLPQSFGPGLRWTKKYIWRLSANGRISVWFVKIDKKQKPSADGDGDGDGQAPEEEADYLFHEFDLVSSTDESAAKSESGEEFVTPPVPPEVGSLSGLQTKIVAARGNHLCIKDMYRTAYAFRVAEGSGEVLSWASRHVVKGPKKGQDIVNLYSRAM
ncbi:hypothetical protein ASPVEDRAFT_35815 [Aspergillus versicolor CBS 583.65]|uniref:DUF6314 domain-containing protein n=1 Tax=Aspergillus versicolor CBS 583.65 TaxID=1036611 RepID=A0A1L9P4P0_ASPVE|nr:uncharacterized protein ASPVEDRAFT_35815 [Aspergillus versicolor CBS 583.65]OJI96414.1 hypothetical protein ASPVEDRAFT_35815 [Aspergillus versicolor CBS 583.65]